MTTSGSLFVRFLVLGFILLAILIVVTKTVPDIPVPAIAGGIILTAVSMVGMYTLAVKRDKELLLEVDAPDLAYYLGFSMTVAALALTFLSDLMVIQSQSNDAQQAAQKSLLIERALSLFGAGLLATLFGLCAKIYLASMQATCAQDPTAVANKFRLELAEFSRLIDLTSNDLSSSIRNGCEAINSASAQAVQSINSMAEQIKQSSAVISSSFTAERIGSPVTAFLKEVEVITEPLANLKDGLGRLNVGIEQISSSGEKYNAIMQASTNALGAHTTKVISASDESAKFSQSIVGLTKETDSFQASIRSAANSIDSIAAPSAALVPRLDATSTSLGVLTSRSNDLINSVSAVTQELVVQVEHMTRINDAIQSAVASLTSLSINSANIGSSFASGQQSIGQWASELESTRQALTSTTDAATTMSAAMRLSTEAQKSSEASIQTSAASTAAFNSRINEMSLALTEISRALNELQVGALSLSSRLGPLGETAARTEPVLATLSTTLQTTSSSVAQLKSSAENLTTRLQGIQIKPDRE